MNYDIAAQWSRVPTHRRTDLLRQPREDVLASPPCQGDDCRIEHHRGPTGEAIPPCDVCQTAVVTRAVELAKKPDVPQPRSPPKVVDPPTDYERTRQAYGPVDEDEVVDQGASW